jgi:outer membrane receptor protein involved in Fe transport
MLAVNSTSLRTAMPSPVFSRALPIIALLLASPIYCAEDELQEVVVFGRGERLIGIAEAASEGAVGGADLAVRPMLRVAELLEAVPGLIAAQHSGSGKANQYFLRGFNLDHGTDFTTYVDGVPWNLRSHGHGQGYLDVNGLIPEVVERIDYRKGPYRADLGDFALAGAALMTTIEQLDHSFVSVEGGQYGWKRLAGGENLAVGPGSLMLVGQLKRYDGPWQQPEALRHVSFFGKYSQATALGDFTASLSAYDATWRPTEQIPERAIGTAICADAYCALDTSATGKTTRYIASFNLTNPEWKASAYAQFYDWNMYSDPTYDAQIHQWDRRFTFGGRFERKFTLTDRLQWSAGAETRQDNINKVQVDSTVQRQFIGFISPYQVNESSLAAFSEATLQVSDNLRLLGGLRADYYHFKAEATAAAFASGSKDDHIVSPKLGAAWRLTSQLEVYANWGRGFHSNDARGIAATTPAVPGLVAGTGKEVGARYQRGTFNVTGTYWWLDVASELKFVGDSNSVEPGSASSRRGYEIVSFWRPVPWLAIDGVWTVSHARVDSQGDATQVYIAGAVEDAGELGVAIVKGPWELSGRLRHLGPYPLVEDNSQRADAEDVINIRAAWKYRQLTLYGELLNALNDHGKDIVYYYESQLSALGETEPVAGRLSRADEPRTLRFGLKCAF